MSARRSISMALVWLCTAAVGLAWCGAPAMAVKAHAFGASFGSEGSAESELIEPSGVAVNDTTGDVYVVDKGNNRVQEFSATGSFIAQFNGSATPTGAFSSPTGIAVDDSGSALDPSNGDVYVIDAGHDAIDKFSASGIYEEQITEGKAGSPFGELDGVAVDSAGTVWVYQGSGEIDSFSDGLANAFLSKRSSPFVTSPGFAVNSEDDLYVNRGADVFAKLDSSGETLEEEVGGQASTAAAVDPASDEVYIDNVSTIAAFTAAGSLVERFGSGHLSSGQGVAVNPVSGTVYVADAAADAVAIFPEVVFPEVVTGAASGVGESMATVAGTVNPGGVAVVSCEFEYGASVAYGQSGSCVPNPGSGEAGVAVSSSLTGLSPLSVYHYRLTAVNAYGEAHGLDGTFTTAALPVVGEEGVSDVSSTGARFGAQVNPDGSDTTFRFEYGTSVGYGQSVPAPAGDLGAGLSVEPVGIRAQNLQPQTVYHVRLAATNALGTVYGPDETFTTQAAGGELVLPDGRAWELVSPPNKYGAAIEPFDHGVYEAAENGSAITYVVNGPFTATPAGNPSPLEKTQAISRRSGAGVWSTEDIATPRATGSEEPTRNSEYLFFSSDLSHALVEPGTTLLSPEATEPTLYLRDNGTGSYRPLVTASNVPAGVKFGLTKGTEEIVGRIGTPDLSHVLFNSKAALTQNAIGGPEEQKLYEWADGRLTLVSVLPNGEASEGHFGDKNEELRHVVSNDGSRVFWAPQGEGSEALYMSDTVTGQTVKVNAPAPGVAEPTGSNPCFQLANTTGSKVFFLEDEALTADSKLPQSAHLGGCYRTGEIPRDLYVYDTEAKTLTDLTVDHLGSELAGVESEMLGASEDGTVIYFVATGRLAEGAQAGAENLYVESQTGATWSAPRLIAILSSEDSPSWADHGNIRFGEGPASSVSTDGRFVTFMSDRSLTGYDNRDAGSGQPDEEVFLYDETSGHLTCVSCDPTGARPTGVLDDARKHQLLSDYQGELWQGHWLAADVAPGEYTEEVGSNNLSGYQPRSLADSGRLFFTSFDSLVPQDTDGVADVYEYEPDGVGSCGEAGGCVSLISSGTSNEEAAFLDASAMGPGGEEGEDVFFMTTSRLTSRDYDSSYDIYDAHVCSGAVPCASVAVASPECSSGDSCKPAPLLQPAIFGSPASATFAGAGNLPSSSSVASSKPAAGKKHKKAVKHRKRRRLRKRGTVRSRHRGLPAGGRDAGRGRGR